MPDVVKFHFVLLAAGEVLKVSNTVTPQDIQNYICQDEAFGVRVPLDSCRMALRLLGDCGFVKPVTEGQYARAV